MKVKIHNDGKEKHQSYEAYIDIDDFDADFVACGELRGYGATEYEAIKELQLKVSQLTKQLERFNALDADKNIC